MLQDQVGRMGSPRSIRIEHPDHVTTGFASAKLFPLLGVRARVGRLFGSSEERQGNDHVTVLTDSFFESHYHRDPSALRSCLALAGHEHLRLAYTEALRRNYLWHEFGDLHLILT